MKTQKFDLVVLGGGNATSLAMRCAKEGQSVALIEADLLGGTCPNRGCVPSKLLLGFAEVATSIKHAARFYMDANLDWIDLEKIRVETQTETIGSTDEWLEEKLPEGCTLFRGFGKFVGERQIEVDGKVLEGKKVLVATGTRPRVPEVFHDHSVWTSDDVFSMDNVPESIAIVGGGYIACELAWFFSSMGVETTMLVRSEKLLADEDGEIQKNFKEGFCQEVDVQFRTEVSDVRETDAGFVLELEGGDSRRPPITVDRVLVTTGRESTADKIDPEAGGIELDDDGYIVTDGHLKTSVEGVYALGDIIGKYFFTHTAAFEAIYLGDCWLDGETDPIDYGPVPHAVFSYPEIAGVGKTEETLKDEGTEYLVGSVPFTSAAKGRAIKERHGLCKFLVAPDGTILGCHIVGHHASILLHEVIPVMKWRNEIDSLTKMIHIHPALSEVVRNAARKAHSACKDHES